MIRTLIGLIYSLSIFSLSFNVLASDAIEKLSAYIHSNLDEYHYEVVDEFSAGVHAAAGCWQCEIKVLRLHSLIWQPNTAVPAKWQHWLTITLPEIDAENWPSTVLLFIDGGQNRIAQSAPDSVNFFVRTLSSQTNAIVAHIKTIPNQKIRFTDDGDPDYQTEGRKEGELIAYSWRQFMNTGDPLALAELPMTKSVVRAMDAVSDYLAKTKQIAIKDFVLMGASKRGLTAWSTAAVDSRVKAIIPLSTDMLNIPKSFRHHFQIYGGYSEHLEHYQAQKLLSDTAESTFEMMQQPRYQALLDFVDPYQFRQRLKIPKYMINGAGDEYFLPDSSQFYLSELPGQNYLRYLPNVGHGIGLRAGLSGWWQLYQSVLPSIAAFTEAIIHDDRLPEYQWRYIADNEVIITTTTTPTHVYLWQASNAVSRDFRLDRVGKIWQRSVLTDSTTNEYHLKVAYPDRGYRAFMVELHYRLRDKPLVLTTDVKILKSKVLLEAP